MRQESFFFKVLSHPAVKNLSKDELWKSAANIWDENEGQIYPGHIQDAVDRAKKGAVSRPLNRLDADLRQGSPDQKIHEAAEFGAVMDSLHELRAELFGNVDVPFQSQQEAAEWIEKLYRERPKPSIEEKKVYRLQHQILKKCAELERLLHRCPGDVKFEVGSTKLPYGGNKSVPLSRNSHLIPLARLTEEMKRSTGFSQWQLVRYVLTGKTPTLSGTPSWHVHIGRHGIRYYAVVVMPPDVQRKDLQKLRRDMRKEYQITKKKGFNNADWKLLEMVRDTYDGEHRPVGKEWDELAGRWKSSQKGKKTGGAVIGETLRRHWYRLEQKANQQGMPNLIKDFLKAKHLKPKNPKGSRQNPKKRRK